MFNCTPSFLSHIFYRNCIQKVINFVMLLFVFMKACLFNFYFPDLYCAWILNWCLFILLPSTLSAAFFYKNYWAAKSLLTLYLEGPKAEIRTVFEFLSELFILTDHQSILSNFQLVIVKLWKAAVQSLNTKHTKSRLKLYITHSYLVRPYHLFSYQCFFGIPASSVRSFLLSSVSRTPAMMS